MHQHRVDASRVAAPTSRAGGLRPSGETGDIISPPQIFPYPPCCPLPDLDPLREGSPASSAGRLAGRDQKQEDQVNILQRRAAM